MDGPLVSFVEHDRDISPVEMVRLRTARAEVDRFTNYCTLVVLRRSSRNRNEIEKQPNKGSSLQVSVAHARRESSQDFNL